MPINPKKLIILAIPFSILVAAGYLLILITNPPTSTNLTARKTITAKIIHDAPLLYPFKTTIKYTNHNQTQTIRYTTQSTYESIQPEIHKYLTSNNYKPQSNNALYIHATDNSTVFTAYETTRRGLRVSLTYKPPK